MKNYVKEGQKLPLYGVGPMIVLGMGAVTAIGIILFAYVWKTGILETPWMLLCRIAGALLIVLGLAVWFIGALRVRHGCKHRRKPAGDLRHLCLGAQSHVQRLVDAVCRHLSPVAQCLSPADRSCELDDPDGDPEVH